MSSDENCRRISLCSMRMSILPVSGSNGNGVEISSSPLANLRPSTVNVICPACTKSGSTRRRCMRRFTPEAVSCDGLPPTQLMSQVVILERIDVSAKKDTWFKPNSCCHKEYPPLMLYTVSPATANGLMLRSTVTSVTPSGFVAVTALVNINSLWITL